MTSRRALGDDQAASLGGRVLHVLQEHGLGLGPHELDPVAEHGLGDRRDVVLAGQVGVENTWMWTGRARSWRACLVSARRPLSPLETSRTASTSEPNS